MYSHLIRNSLKYVPRKDYKAFTFQLKGIYGALNSEATELAFEQFKVYWARYPGAVRVWANNWYYTAVV